jgi:mevalonate kinase
MTQYKKISDVNRAGLFYSKLLLFGEYSILFDSMALYIPFSHFTADLSFPDRGCFIDYGHANASNALLERYAAWLEGLGSAGEQRVFLDTVTLKRDIAKGLFLDSSIPQGYGLGSSGALCAALYDKYALDPVVSCRSADNKDMLMLKKIFGILEKWFHDTSSGLDPLCCYLRRPILVNPDESISLLINHEHYLDNGAAIFLIDTGQSGKTGPLVKLFMEWSRKRKFKEMINSVMIPAVNKCVSSMVKPDLPALMSGLKALSLFQLHNMKAMIPGRFNGIWERGAESGDFYIKLCGSGGGGYILGFTLDMEKTSLVLAREGIDILPVYQPGSIPILKNLTTINKLMEKV